MYFKGSKHVLFAKVDRSGDNSSMSVRISGKNEASGRSKSEFLVQFDRVTLNSDDFSNCHR